MSADDNHKALALDALADIAKDPLVDPAVRLEAARTLLYRPN